MASSVNISTRSKGMFICTIFFICWNIFFTSSSVMGSSIFSSVQKLPPEIVCLIRSLTLTGSRSCTVLQSSKYNERI